MASHAGWPATGEALAEAQRRLAADAARLLAEDPFVPPSAGRALLVGGCFVAYGTGGERAWAAAAVDTAPAGAVVARAVVAGRPPAPYAPGLLALREGPLLAAAVAALDVRADVLLVDATGLDHPRGAGLAVHLGAVTGLATVGVTDKPLAARSPRPPPQALRRGDARPVLLDGRPVAAWVATRDGVRPLLVHAAWRTGVDAAVAVVLAASGGEARAPRPVREARILARLARRAGGG